MAKARARPAKKPAATPRRPSDAVRPAGAGPRSKALNRVARGLFHLGSYEFCPIGAENVRVRFAESAGAVLLTVHDPDVVLTARKKATT